MMNAKTLLSTMAAVALVTACHKVEPVLKDEPPGAVRLPVTVVENRQLEQVVSLPGVVSALPDHSVKVSPAISGKLIKIMVVPGQSIGQGQLIAQLDSRTLQSQLNQTSAALSATDAAVEQARTSLRLAQDTAARTQRLVSMDIAAQKDLVATQSQVQTAQEQLAAAKAQVAQATATRSASTTQLDYTKIHAPICGIVARRFLNVGDTADPNTPIAQIVDLSTVVVNANLPAVMPAKIRVGDSASVTSSALPGVEFLGKVTMISPVVDAQSTTVPVQIRCANIATELKEGMPVMAAIVVARHENALVVPATAIVADPESPDARMVYKFQSGKIRRVKVTTGIERDGLVEITNGLFPGESVVAQGAYGLPDDTSVEAEVAQVHHSSKISIKSH